MSAERSTSFVEEPDTAPSDAYREGLVVGDGAARIGYPERKVGPLSPEEFRNGDC